MGSTSLSLFCPASLSLFLSPASLSLFLSPASLPLFLYPASLSISAQPLPFLPSLSSLYYPLESASRFDQMKL